MGTLCSFCFSTSCPLRFQLFVPCYWTVWYIPTTQDLSKPSAPVEWMLLALVCAFDHGQQTHCTCSSMTFPRSFTLAFVMKLNERLFTLLQMLGWLNGTLRRHVQPCTFTAYLTGAIFPTTTFTCHLLSHDTMCQVLRRNVFDHPVSHSSFGNGNFNKTLSRFHTKGIVCISNVLNKKGNFYCHQQWQNGNRTPLWKI
jgi:hypothetical protein